jgi:hypothetical protein
MEEQILSPNIARQRARSVRARQIFEGGQEANMPSFYVKNRSRERDREGYKSDMGYCRSGQGEKQHLERLVGMKRVAKISGSNPCKKSRYFKVATIQIEDERGRTQKQSLKHLELEAESRK